MSFYGMFHRFNSAKPTLQYFHICDVRRRGGLLRTAGAGGGVHGVGGTDDGVVLWSVLVLLVSDACFLMFSTCGMYSRGGLRCIPYPGHRMLFSVVPGLVMDNAMYMRMVALDPVTVVYL